MQLKYYKLGFIVHCGDILTVKKAKSHISSIIALLSVMGLLASMVHYHSEGLGCLEHAQEAHYIENTDTCPLTTLVVHFGVESDLAFDGFIKPGHFFHQEDGVFYKISYCSLSVGRDPPSMA